MDYYSSQITKLIEELSKLPGVGSKSAQRLAFHIINMPQEQVEGLAGAIVQAKANIRYCKECFTLTDQELCPICSSRKRDHGTIMVVENTRDLAAYEKTDKYEGVYSLGGQCRRIMSSRPVLKRKKGREEGWREGNITSPSTPRT